MCFDGLDLYKITEVSKIWLNKQGKHLQYLICWEGYGPEDNTWELLEHLGDFTECLEELYEIYLNAQKEMAQG
jgi:hypothetical protein